MRRAKDDRFWLMLCHGVMEFERGKILVEALLQGIPHKTPECVLTERPGSPFKGSLAEVQAWLAEVGLSSTLVEHEGGGATLTVPQEVVERLGAWGREDFPEGLMVGPRGVRALTPEDPRK